MFFIFLKKEGNSWNTLIFIYLCFGGLFKGLNGGDWGWIKSRIGGNWIRGCWFCWFWLDCWLLDDDWKLIWLDEGDDNIGGEGEGAGVDVGVENNRKGGGVELMNDLEYWLLELVEETDKDG